MKVSEILENERAQSDPDVQNIPVSEEFCSKQNSRFSSVKCDTYGVKIVHGGERGSKSNLKLYIIFPQ